MRKILVIIVVMVVAFASANAQQYRFEIGGGAGVSGYFGDANNGNMWKKPGYDAGLVFRYLPDTRWAIKANLLTASISGDSKNIQNVYPDGQTYSFKSQLYDIGAQIEFNFLNYGFGPSYKKLKRISPYLTLGIGATLSTTDGSQAFAMNVPLGLGVKYKLKERLNLGFEFTMRKAFGDKLDGLSDLNGIKSSFGKNTDWYSITMFTITYEFSKRCTKCHYVE